MDVQALRSRAALEGFEEAACPSCAGSPSAGSPNGAACANCGGTGRLWVKGARSLSDEGLRRLRVATHLVIAPDRATAPERADLRVERAFFARVQRALYEAHGDMLVVIRERTVVGVFPDLRTAENEARIRCGRVPVLIERLGMTPRPFTNAPAARRRDVERLRTLRDALREVLRASRRDRGVSDDGDADSEREPEPSE